MRKTPRLGQYFLKSKNVLENIVMSLSLQKGDLVIEIGPGKGALTDTLLKESMEKGFEIIAVEKDHALAHALATRFEKNSHLLRLVEDDIRTFLPRFTNENPELARKTYKIVGNIPYYLTGHLFRIIGELSRKPAQTVLMVQKEVAERIVAKPPRMSRLSASIAFWATSEFICHVSKKEFSPQPKVDSAVIRLISHPQDTQHDAHQKKLYYHMVGVAFQQPRKTLMNNIIHGCHISREKLGDIMASMGISLNARPGVLTQKQILSLALACENYCGYLTHRE